VVPVPAGSAALGYRLDRWGGTEFGRGGRPEGSSARLSFERSKMRQICAHASAVNCPLRRPVRTIGFAGGLSRNTARRPGRSGMVQARAADDFATIRARMEDLRRERRRRRVPKRR
jgi:hypothetical protein